ncbi:uncharacterized protein LOC105353899 [Oryzias latipes]|uniref:uncharacterized protein LOC105353899 n=1 Tax=Oryzias latipes TaxID=8090 RepID=UPI0005CC472E|nr:uncharacterized protein LOC105353899 [Oryzias latipes]
MAALFFSLLLFVVIAWSEGKNIYSRYEGENVTLTCSSSTNTGYIGLYLYHSLNETKEVLFFNSQSPEPSVRANYKGKIVWNGSFTTLNITLTNLTANSEGIYTCEYKSHSHEPRTSQIYGLHIKGLTEQKCNTIESSKDCPPDSPILMTAIVLICIFFMVVIAFILALPKIKQRMYRGKTTEQNATKSPGTSTEYVYEDMRKNPMYSRVGHQPCPQA